MKRLPWAARVACATLAALCVVAHAAEPKKDPPKTTSVTGIVTFLDDKRISVQTKDGKTQSLRVTEQTAWGTKTKKKVPSDFKVTDKVTIEFAEDQEGHWAAHTVRFSR